MSFLVNFINDKEIWIIVDHKNSASQESNDGQNRALPIIEKEFAGYSINNLRITSCMRRKRKSCGNFDGSFGI